MQSTEIEQIIQLITDQVVTRLEAVTKDKILFEGEYKAYPASYLEKLSADYYLEFGTKQDGDAILLCLRQVTITQLLAISHLNVIDSLTERAINALLNGSKIWIFDQTPRLVNYRSHTRYEVWKTLRISLEKLAKFDVHFIQSEEDFEQQMETLYSIQKTQKTITPKIKFVTESDVKKRWMEHEPLIRFGESLTALANDWVTQHQTDK
jgi:ethanolamine utilization protein